MTARKFYGRSVPGRPEPEWQPLETHLRNAATLAAGFAATFDSEEWGRLAGLWHDLGKYQDEFQRRLHGESISVEHAGVGARLAFEEDQGRGLALAFVIAGHHSGLTNLQTADTGTTHLVKRLKRNAEPLAACRPDIPTWINECRIPVFPKFLESYGPSHNRETETLRLRTEFWVRFLFSCLVDADRSDAASVGVSLGEDRRTDCATITELCHRCDDFIDTLAKSIPANRKEHVLNHARADILHQCREAAKQAPGVFSLTVPTGGGKTLSGMSFALNHAEIHHLRRVIVVIPYTSIIEQNAAIYRQCLGKENVLEHHSNLDPQAERDQLGAELIRKHQLAAENWDVPVIVTTSVQFFESLFTSHPSKARKLHNIARSVIILDEVQTLPPGLLNPILDGLNQLTTNYGCSVVLSTATPPALAARERFEQGLMNVRNVISDSKALAEKLQRVTIEWPQERSSGLELPELASQLARQNRVLCVVHKRRDARELAQLLAEQTSERVFHLSALMCPAHRLQVIREIRKQLGSDGPCRVVSTQLIEAGVDLDFPVVYRALAGLDSIIQVAGRCNREGLLKSGRVVVFRSMSKPPRGVPRTALDVTEVLLGECEGVIDTNDPAIFEEYFRRLYFNRTLDEKNIQANRRAFNFATVGRDFQMIEDGFTYTLVVPWEDAEERVSRLRAALEHDLPTRDCLRALQPYTVNIYEKSFAALQKAAVLEEIIPGIYFVSPTYKELYDDRYGLIDGDEAPRINPENLIC